MLTTSLPSVQKTELLFFGTIDHGAMYLSKLGEVAKNELTQTPSIRRDMNLTISKPKKIILVRKEKTWHLSLEFTNLQLPCMPEK